MAEVSEGRDVAEIEESKGQEGYELLSKLGVPASLGERMLLLSPKPQVEEELPEALRAEEQMEYDKTKYDFRSHVAALLHWAGPKIGFGCFGSSNELELFQAKEEVFSSFKYEKRSRQCILDSSEFLACYELLLKEVVCPNLKTKLKQDGPIAFYCQFPPTLRLQPGPSERPRRLHRDAEFGHQANTWAFSSIRTNHANLRYANAAGAGYSEPSVTEMNRRDGPTKAEILMGRRQRGCLFRGQSCGVTPFGLGVALFACVDFMEKDGEVNFWMPLTNYDRTKTTLWVESKPNANDFHPLSLDVGKIAMFHGTLVRHYAPPNSTTFLRVSMDFRVGVGRYFDPDWKLEGLQHYHGRRKITL
ncbi:unnamed protein product [Durusdinium trenchii]|uniref:Uncharacterized protein n=1 Tax=Durusdinium trenchii TaxID=1381693 RepID=A0ABP0IV23_9DINO